MTSRLTATPFATVERCAHSSIELERHRLSEKSEVDLLRKSSFLYWCIFALRVQLNASPNYRAICVNFYIDRKKRLAYHHFEDFSEGENPKCFL